MLVDWLLYEFEKDHLNSVQLLLGHLARALGAGAGGRCFAQALATALLVGGLLRVRRATTGGRVPRWARRVLALLPPHVQQAACRRSPSAWLLP